MDFINGWVGRSIRWMAGYFGGWWRDSRNVKNNEIDIKK
jgi:hypothetical protein